MMEMNRKLEILNMQQTLFLNTVEEAELTCGLESAQALAFVVKILAVLAAADAARILVVMPLASKSHHISLCTVTQALEDRGHDVTYVTGLEPGNQINPASHKLIHVVNEVADDIRHRLLNELAADQPAIHSKLTFLMDAGQQMATFTLSHSAFRAEINKPGQRYDLIIIEAFFFQEAFIGLGHQFNAPVVAFNPGGTMLNIDFVMGNPFNPSWVPALHTGYSNRMSFVERAMNTLHQIGFRLYYFCHCLPTQQSVLSEHWPDAPSIKELLRSRLALTLMNDHYTLGYPVPLSPGVVEIGGVHIPENPKPLPKELRVFLDAAKQGVIYFSMGSNVRMAELPKHKIDAILGALSDIGERVLLKWDGPIPPNLTSNVRAIEWAPQSALLAHPNIRAFITHGGLLSIQEAVYHGVPLIGLPVFGDQLFNIRLATRKGFCIRIDMANLTRPALDDALKEVLRNPKYKDAASRLSRLFRSKVVQPLPAAVWAVEHVLQHGGEHMRPSSVDLPLYQLFLLDVLLATILIIILVLAIAVLCYSALCCRHRKARGDAAKKHD